MLEDSDFQQNSLDVMKMSISWIRESSQSIRFLAWSVGFSELTELPTSISQGLLLVFRRTCLWQRCRWAVWSLRKSDFFHGSLVDHCLILHSGITNVTTTTHLPPTNFLLIAPKQLGVADQALEVLLASKHALVDSQGFGCVSCRCYVLGGFFPQDQTRGTARG